MVKAVKNKNEKNVSDILDKPGVPPEFKPSAWKMREFADDSEVKMKVLKLFEEGVTTLSEAGEKLNVSPYTLYKMKKADPEFAAELEIAKDIVADRLEGDLLNKDIKYPEAFGRVFLLNGLRPEKYKNIKLSVDNPRLEEYVKKLKEAGEIKPMGKN